jgi:hypothetical protein
MKSLCTTILLCVTATTGAAQPPSAEPWLRRGTWLVTVEFGGAAFSDFQRTLATPAAGVGDVPKLERRISASTTATLGASVEYWMSDGVAVRTSLSFAPARFRVWNDAEGQRALARHGNAEAAAAAALGVWFADAALAFRLPLHLSRVVPYGLVGGGAVHYRVRDHAALPPEARRRFADGDWTGPAGVIGIGATLPLQRNNLLMSFELTNHIARTPLDDEGAGEWFEVAGLPFQIGQGDGSADAIALTNNLRLTLGLTLPLRNGRAPPP